MIAGSRILASLSQGQLALMAKIKQTQSFLSPARLKMTIAKQVLSTRIHSKFGLSCTQKEPIRYAPGDEVEARKVFLKVAPVFQAGAL